MSDPVKPDNVQLIDVEQVFATKDAKLLKRIPKFLIRYLKKIVHQDEINAFLTHLAVREKLSASSQNQALGVFAVPLSHGVGW